MLVLTAPDIQESLVDFPIAHSLAIIVKEPVIMGVVVNMRP
jgi:hypothetical protein